MNANMSRFSHSFQTNYYIMKSNEETNPIDVGEIKVQQVKEMILEGKVSINKSL